LTLTDPTAKSSAFFSDDCWTVPLHCPATSQKNDVLVAYYNGISSLLNGTISNCDEVISISSASSIGPSCVSIVLPNGDIIGKAACQIQMRRTESDCGC